MGDNFLWEVDIIAIVCRVDWYPAGAATAIQPWSLTLCETPISQYAVWNWLGSLEFKLYFTTWQISVHTELANSTVTPGEPRSDYLVVER